jgi:excisionase family DNA binding protein
MANFLTTRQLQDMLQVDRTTIYRMADDGRIPALKVGNQWRFPSQQVNDWLQMHSADGDSIAPSAQSAADLCSLLPMECVQQIQDAFAEALGVMIVITDMDGQPVTEPSNPFGLFTAVEADAGSKHCLRLWARLGRIPSLQPAWIESHLGLLCARGLIRTKTELRGMVIIGGIAPNVWPPGDEKIQQIASDLHVDGGLIRQHAQEVYCLDAAKQTQVLAFAQRIADIVTHIISERNHLFSRLNDIALLTKI